MDADSARDLKQAMRTLAILFTFLIITGCGLMPPETVFMGDDRLENEQQVARLCGDDSDIIAIVWYDTIEANVISVDGRVVPAFEREKRNLFGLRTVPSLRSYCLALPRGEHKVTLLAVRTRGLGKASGTEYYFGVCNVVTQANHVYTTVPVRSDNWRNEITVHIMEKHKDDPTGICRVDQVSRETIFELLDTLVNETR